MTTLDIERALSKAIHRLAKTTCVHGAVLAPSREHFRNTIWGGPNGIGTITDGRKNAPRLITATDTIYWPNTKSKLQLFTPSDPSRLRGPQFHFALVLSPSKFPDTKDDSGLTALEQLPYTVRLGINPRIITIE